jgi:hypothetical protein
MDKPTYTLRNFKSLAISQRAFCSCVGMALLKADYHAGTPNWMKLEKALARVASATKEDGYSTCAAVTAPS